MLKLLKNSVLHPDILQEILKELSKSIDLKNDTNLLLRLSYVDCGCHILTQLLGKPPIYCSKNEEISSKICQCWCEAFYFQNVEKRHSSGEPVIPKLAIVLQEIVNIDQIGILTTTNTNSGYIGEIVIKANYGRFTVSHQHFFFYLDHFRFFLVFIRT